MTATGNRISCCVPHCRRTRANTEGWDSWICGEHWRLVPKKMRAVKNRNAREIRSAIAKNPLVAEYWKMPPGAPERIAAVRLWNTHDRIWSRCKRAAIEKGMGI